MNPNLLTGSESLTSRNYVSGTEQARVREQIREQICVIILGHDIALYDTTWYDLVWHSMIPHYMMLHYMISHDLTCYGLAWPGMARHDKTWYDMT